MTRRSQAPQYQAARYASMKAHQIKTRGIAWFLLPVSLLASDNTYLAYPCAGVIRLTEQATDLYVRVGVFHQQLDDGRLGPPVEVVNPVFAYMGRS